MLAMTMPLVFAVAGRETRRPGLLKLIALCVPVVILMTGHRGPRWSVARSRSS